MKKTIAILIFSFLFCTVTAQTKETEQLFYNYFLWYDGTIGEQAIKAKISLRDGNYTVSYAYNHNKKWINLIDSKIDNSTISAKASLKTDNYTDGFVELDMKNLWKLTGQWISQSGEKLPISLKVALKELPASLKNTIQKNEFTPLLLNPTVVADSINVYYSEKNENGKRSPIEKQTYTKIYPNIDNQIIYVDVNFDGYLDLSISNAIYIFNTKKQRFEVENKDSDFYPGINYINAYDLYNKTFQSSHWRTVIWYKAIDGIITPYEIEYYNEYDNKENNHNIGVSENRIRQIGKEEKYSILELYLEKETTLNTDEIVKKFIGNSTIGILDNAQLILHYPSGKTNFYRYKNSTWKLLYTEVEGKKIYPEVKKYHTNGKLKEIGFYNEQGYKTGEWKEYYLSGKLYSLSIYKGFSIYWKHYYENGQLKESGKFIEHKKQGKWNYYLKNGDLTKAEIYYSLGVLEEKKRYYKGILYAEEYYKNGKKEGVWKYYNQQNGKLKQIEHYTKGKGNGDFKSFFANGNLIYSYSQVNGTTVGERKDYYESGKIKKIQTFEDGRIATYKRYYESGPISASKVFYETEILAKSFYEIGGELVSIGYLKNTHGFVQIGKWKYYHQNGKLHYKVKNSYTKRTKTKGYHANGKRKFKGYKIMVENDGNYNMKETGKWKFYYKTGKLSGVGNFLNEEKVGEWKYYQENRKLDRIENWLDGKLISTEKK